MLEKLNTLGVTIENIMNGEKIEYDPATVKDAKKETVYKAHIVDIVMDAFMGDMKQLIEIIQQKDAEINALEQERQSLNDEIDRLTVETQQQEEIEAKISQFEQLMDLMESKVKEALEARRRDLETLTNMKQEHEDAVSRVQELQQKDAELNELKAVIEDFQSANEEMSKALEWYETNYEKLESDINTAIKSFKDVLKSNGVEFQTVDTPQSSENTVDEDMESSYEYNDNEVFNEEYNEDFEWDEQAVEIEEE